MKSQYKGSPAGADPFDPDRLPPAPPVAPRGRGRTTRPRGEYLRGPVPMGWVRAAAALPGKGLAVGLEVWFVAGCRGSDTVSVTLARLARMVGTSADTARRALRTLEAAGLVTVDRPSGRAPVVTLVRPPAG